MNGGHESFSLVPYAADNAISSGPIDLGNESDDDDPGQVVMLRMENGPRVAMESMRPYMPQTLVAVRQAVHASNSSCSAAQSVALLQPTIVSTSNNTAVSVCSAIMYSCFFCSQAYSEDSKGANAWLGCEKCPEVPGTWACTKVSCQKALIKHEKKCTADVV
jgi:hypothetical protein